MKKKSVIRKAFFMMTVHFILLLVVFFSYLFFSYHTAVGNLRDGMENLIQIYGRELENKINNADMLLERLIYANDDYTLLQSENEAIRYYASVRLKNLIEEQTAYDDYVDAVVMADSIYGVCLDYENRQISLENKTSLRDFVSRGAKKERGEAQWSIEVIGTTRYLYKMYIWQGRAVGAFISVDRFMDNVHDDELNDMTVVLLDNEKRIQSTLGENIPGMKIGKNPEEVLGKLAQKASYELADGRMKICAYVSMSAIWGQIQVNMVLVMIVILTLTVYSIVMLRFIRRELILPTRRMQETMIRMRDGEYTLRIRDEFTSSEFILLKDTFNELADEIVNLRIQSYEKQIDLQETELKCVRLQIRPHFFLNAMTTISSLSQREKNREIQRYIDALSKNIRYMFQSGLHTVTLGEEIRHIENYFEMQELNYPDCVFYYIDIPTELEMWKIPQMLIHTVIENEYKYAVEVDQVLTILIKAEVREEKGEEMLCLSIEDDGGGYPQEVLENFLYETGERHEKPQNGERIGLISIKRMLELMYERDDLFEIGNTVPHGCCNYFWIPKQPIQEIKES